MRHLIIALALTAPVVSAQGLGSLGLPSAPTWSQGQDRIRSSDGVQCETSVVPRNWYMDMGVVGSRGTGFGSNNNGIVIENDSRFLDNNFRRDGVAVYARIVINLDKPKPAIDCNQLYQLEIQRLRAEIEFLTLGSGAVEGTVIAK